MQVFKYLYIGLLGLFLKVRVMVAVSDEFDNFSSPPLLKAFSNAHFGKKVFPSEPPQYMLDLYNQIADSKGIAKSPLPHGASLVRAVPVQVVDERRFSFPLETVPAEESILEAEVHIFHHQLNGNERKLLGPENLLRFSLYLVDELGSTALALSQTVGGHFSGWRVFSVGDAVKEAREKERQVTFVVEATTLDGETIHDKVKHGRHSTNNPLLVLFNQVTNRTMEQVDMNMLKVSRQDRSSFLSSRRVRRSVNSATSIAANSPAGCELRNLIVNFKRIGWSWVVHPTEYDAHHCVGQCSFPLGQELNPTNHATVISIAHFSSSVPDSVRNPSCVPTAYKNLTLLYYDDQDTVILKQFDRMVATQCGCR